MADDIQILTPVGRLVQGNPFVANTTDMQGNPLVVKSGPNVGKPTQQFFCAIAIRKDDPGFADVWIKMNQAAQAGWQGRQATIPNFSWKLIDGDGFDSQGQPYSAREGFAGCYILKFSSSFAPKCYTAGGASVLTDPESIKRGYYIRIYGTTTSNNNPQKPGIYMNLGMVELIGYGEEIKSGPDGAVIFGSAPAGALPPGASRTPLAPQTPIATGVPGMPPMPPQAPAYAPPGMPGAGMPHTAVQGNPGQTHPVYAPPVMPPQAPTYAPVMPPQAPAPAGYPAPAPAGYPAPAPAGYPAPGMTPYMPPIPGR